MKYKSLSAFQKHLRSSAPNHFSSSYLLLSKDRFERTYVLDACLQSIFPKSEDRNLSVKKFEAGLALPHEVKGELGSFSLFGGRQVVVVQEIESAKAPLRDALLEVLAQGLSSSILIVIGESLSAATKLHKQLEKTGVVFDPGGSVKPWEKEKLLVEWVQEEARGLKVQFEPRAATLLVKQVGAQQSLLFQELQKLICYIGNKKVITVADIIAVCLVVPHDTVWQLGEAIFDLHAARAHFLTRKLLKEGLQPLGLLSQLRRQVQTDFQILDVMEKGGSDHDVQQLFPYLRGNILTRHMTSARKYGSSRFKEALISLSAAEFKLKDTAVDGTLIMERLIIGLCL